MLHVCLERCEISMYFILQICVGESEYIRVMNGMHVCGDVYSLFSFQELRPYLNLLCQQFQ